MGSDRSFPSFVQIIVAMDGVERVIKDAISKSKDGRIDRGVRSTLDQALQRGRH